MFRLLRHFSIVSALAIAVLTATLVFGLRWKELHSLHDLRRATQRCACARLRQRDMGEVRLLTSPIRR